MSKKKLFWQFFPSLWFITILALIAITIYISHTLKKVYLSQIISDLQEKAVIIRNLTPDNMFLSPCDDCDKFCNDLVVESKVRLTIIDASGKVLCDSGKDRYALENHASRPEIQKALAGEIASSVRYSQSVNVDMIYAAVPVYRDNRVIGAIRLSLPISSINDALAEIYTKVALGGLAFILMIIFISIFISQKISSPLESMKDITEKFAVGELNYRLPDQETLELAGLADSLNKMAFQLNDRINTIANQKNEQQAILLSMVEGVIAVDSEERIINLNQAAEKILKVTSAEAIGKYIQQAVRNAHIQSFVRRILHGESLVEDEFALARKSDVLIQAHGTILRNAAGRHIGAVIVLNDITRLRQLETVRRDFVANVSHELRTPITSIKGFVETLQEGAIDKPNEARRFLEIIARQVDRLNGIIEDLLALSRIEQQEEKSEIELGLHKIKPVLQASMQICETMSLSGEVLVEIDCDEELAGVINPDLMQQAIVNLLNNAIKYSPKRSAVKISAKRIDGGIKIDVIDNGPGIPTEHHDRIFERFYRVDKERSRSLGGTGLGLAIVRHIVLAHHGKVSLVSAPGQGSIFSIILPEF